MFISTVQMLRDPQFTSVIPQIIWSMSVINSYQPQYFISDLLSVPLPCSIWPINEIVIYTNRNLFSTMALARNRSYFLWVYTTQRCTQFVDSWLCYYCKLERLFCKPIRTKARPLVSIMKDPLSNERAERSNVSGLRFLRCFHFTATN